jgi:mono/diheme cytochrome c family protein
VVEIVAALVYYRTWGKVSRSAHLMIGWVYFVAAYLSLVIINGIVTFMLTPGKWLTTHRFWDGFFNPTYWPGLVLRTGICMLMATAFLLFVAQRGKAEARPALVRYLGWWLVAGALVAYGGYRWWEAALPDTVRALFRGDTPLLTTLASTRSLALWALALALVLGAVLLVMLPRAGRWATAVVVAVAAFTFFGSYERLREGSRKPFLIHSYQFSNGLRVADIERINQQGLVSASGWVAARAGDGPEAYGRAVFQAECSSCHTLDGYQGIRPLLPTKADLLAFASDDPKGTAERVFTSKCAPCHTDYTVEDMKGAAPSVADIQSDPAFTDELLTTMVTGMVQRLHDMGSVYTEADRSQTIDTRKAMYPYMPPMVGSQADMEALGAYLRSLQETAAGPPGGSAEAGAPAATEGGE